MPEVAGYQSWDAPLILPDALELSNTWFKGEWTDDLLFGLLRRDYLS